MNMIKKYLIQIIIITILITVFMVSVVKSNENLNIIQTNAKIASEQLSNKKIGWGLKRASNHAQPDLGTENKALLDMYEGICMGNATQKYVYLTFDEGYEAGYTSKILETLKNNEVTATFFITAHYLNKEEELVKKMIEYGNIVGNHTVNHKSMPDLTDEQIEQEIMNLHKAMYEKTGYEMQYLRPPMGEFSQRTLSLTNSLGYKTVMWSLAYDDWNEDAQKGEEYAKSKILDNIHPGAVILLHGNSKDNANVLDYVIKEIKNMGYEFKTLDEFDREL